MARNANFQEIADGFLSFYYGSFDQKAEERAKLQAIYRDNSKLSFQGDNFQGTNDIMTKLCSLSFTTCRHDFKGHDVQPCGDDAIVIFVTGDLYVDQEKNPLKFAQSFCLKEASADDWYVENDMFRLNIG
jgi:hypothetical protein